MSEKTLFCESIRKKKEHTPCFCLRDTQPAAPWAAQGAGQLLSRSLRLSWCRLVPVWSPHHVRLDGKYPHHFPISPRPFLIVSPAWLKVNENKTSFSQRPHSDCVVVVGLGRGSSGGQGLEPRPSCCVEGVISPEERPGLAASSPSQLPLLSWG